MAEALTFPLALEDFFDGLRITTTGFDLTERMRRSETGGGESLVSDLSPRLWQFRFQVRTTTHAEQRAAEAKARILKQAGRPFFVTDPTAAYPASDPDGSTLGSSTVTIASLNSDNRRLTLTGLPANYELPAGTLLSFTYGSPARYALHEVVAGVTAYGTGTTQLFEVSPFIRPGATVGTWVTLIKPFCKAVMMPGSWEAGPRRVDGFTEGFSFDAIQTLR